MDWEIGMVSHASCWKCAGSHISRSSEDRLLMFVGRCGGSEVSSCSAGYKAEGNWSSRSRNSVKERWLHFALSVFNVITFREGDVLPN